MNWSFCDIQAVLFRTQPFWRKWGGGGGAFKILGKRIIWIFPNFTKTSRMILKNTAQVVCGLKFVVNGKSICSYIDIPKTVLVLFLQKLHSSVQWMRTASFLILWIMWYSSQAGMGRKKHFMQTECRNDTTWGRQL